MFEHPCPIVAVKAVDNTIAANGLALSLLFFKITPWLPITTYRFSAQKKRMSVLAFAQIEMDTIVAERRIEAAWKHNAARSVDEKYGVGDDIMTYWEKEREWTGPNKVAKADDKIVFFKIDRGILQSFHKRHIKPYFHNPFDSSEFFQPSVQLFQPVRNIFFRNIYLTETIQSVDLRAKDTRFDAA